MKLKVSSLLPRGLWLLLQVFCFVARTDGASPLEASIVGYCRSINLGHATGTSGGFRLDAYFTTYDGRSSLPLVDEVAGYYVFSGELLPDNSQAGLYHTDYIVFFAGSPDSYGTSDLRFPISDADANGVPDFLQMSYNGTVDFSGTVYRQAPGTASVPVSGRITRKAGAHLGTYTASLREGAQVTTFTGSTSLLNTFGKVSYIRGAANTATFAVAVTDSEGGTTQFGANTAFTVSGPNSLSFPEFRFLGAAGAVITTRPFILARNGTRYVGDLELADGGSRTSWRDYIRWRVRSPILTMSTVTGFRTLPILLSNRPGSPSSPRA